MNSVLGAYKTTYKTMIRPTPFWMTFGLQVVMAIKFHIPSLRVHVTKQPDEEQSEKIGKAQLLA